MNVIKTVKDFFAIKKDKVSNTTYLFKTADMTSEALGNLLEALQNPAFSQSLISVLNVRSRPNGPRTYLTGAAYEHYLKHLPPQWKKLEERRPLCSIIAITGTMISDLRDLMAHFRDWFSEENIKDEDVRLSNLIIAGYIESCYRFCNWLQWMFIARDHFNRTGGKVKDDEYSPAKYIAKSIENALPTVFKVEEEILYRRSKTSFSTILIAMRNSNKDVSIKSDGIDITTYADDSSYSKVELEYTAVGLVNPFMSAARHIAQWQRDNYEKNRDLREWISMRIALVEQQQNGMDPNSPEYKKAEAIMKKYLDQISHLDAKIKKYEIQY